MEFVDPRVKEAVQTLQAVVFQFEHGEASDLFARGVTSPDTRRDLRWCRDRLKDTLRNLQRVG